MTQSKTLGKDYESRELSKKVRDLALEKIYKELSGKGSKDKRFQQALLLKLAGTVLPRLNAGRDDNERLIPEPLLGGKTKNGLPPDNSDEEAPDAS